MKLTTARLKKLIREELSRMTEQYEIDEENMPEGDPREPYLTASNALEPNYEEFIEFTNKGAINFSNVDPMSLDFVKLAIGAHIALDKKPGEVSSLEAMQEILKKAGISDALEVLKSIPTIVDMKIQRMAHYNPETGETKPYGGERYNPEANFYYDENKDEFYVPSQAI